MILVVVFFHLKFLQTIFVNNIKGCVLSLLNKYILYTKNQQKIVRF